MRETLIRDLEEDLGRATAYLKVLAMDVETRFANGPVQCASLSHHVEQHTLSGSGLLSVRPEDLLPSILPGVVRDFFWGDGFSDVRKHGLHERAVQTPCGDFTSLVVADWEHDGADAFEPYRPAFQVGVRACQCKDAWIFFYR